MKPRAGTNERDLSIGREEKLAAIQRLALFPPQLQPPGEATVSQPFPVDRPAGIDYDREAEAAAARARKKGAT